MNNNSSRYQVGGAVLSIIALIIIGAIAYTFTHTIEEKAGQNVDQAVEESIDNGVNQNNSTAQSTPQNEPTIPLVCINQTDGKALITQLSQSKGRIGDSFEIEGCNLSSPTRYYQMAIITNAQGKNGILYGNRESTMNRMIVALNSPVCAQDLTETGLACNDLLYLEPGIYSIHVEPQGSSTKSNSVEFIVE